jgi:hypothetical protein
VRDKALADARVTIDKVSALSAENAIGLDLQSYADAVALGEAWPKPWFATIHQDAPEPLPFWANGAAFNVTTDRTGSYPEVLVSYAVAGQGSAGSGFNTRVANVLVCVAIGIEFVHDEVDVYGSPSIAEIQCPDDVQKYFMGELVTLDEVRASSW